MRRATCSLCHELPRTKMASVYWAWYWPAGDRAAWKQRFDPVCAMPIMARLQYALDNPENCSGCHERITGDADVQVWFNLYVPGRDVVNWSLLFDAACFEHEADTFTAGADRLLNREAGGGGPPASSPRPDPWEAVGIQAPEST